MIRPELIAEDLENITVVESLTGVFQSIASMQIAHIKRQVQASHTFFEELWRLYNQIWVDEDMLFGNREVETDKQLFIVITAEGGFSGDIDRKLIDWMLGNYQVQTTDIICIGHHGAVQLAQAGVSVVEYFKLPPDDRHIDVTPMLELIERYPSATAYYQTYVSLGVQDVKRISLQRAVESRGRALEGGEEVIEPANYIFEPSVEEVVGYLETQMIGITLAQVILESKLAQYASRFQAMSMARDKASELIGDLRLDYDRARRSVNDERLKEISAGMRSVRMRRERRL